MVQNLKKVLKSKISKFFSFLRHEVPFKAKNNREAVVVCAIHVVKRPSKRSVLVYNISTRFDIKVILVWELTKVLIKTIGVMRIRKLKPVDINNQK